MDPRNIDEEHQGTATVDSFFSEWIELIKRNIDACYRRSASLDGHIIL